MTRLLLVLLALAAAGCDGGFQPTASDGRAFALYGTLDGRSGTQRLRVQDLAASPFQTPAVLAATVTSTELLSGAVTRWRDSLVTLADGSNGHLFLADLTVRPGEVHEIAAVRASDGAVSTVRVTLPAPQITVDPRSGPDVVATVYVAGLLGATDNVRQRYRVEAPGGLNATDLVYTVPPLPPPEASFALNLGQVLRQAQERLYAPSVPPDRQEVVLADLRLEALARSLAGEPVQNGAGEVGWILPLSVPIPAPSALVTQAGFTDAR